MASVANKAILLGMLVALAIFNVGEPTLTMVESVAPQTTSVAIQLYGVAQEKLFCMVSACAWSAALTARALPPPHPTITTTSNIASGGRLGSGRYRVQC